MYFCPLAPPVTTAMRKCYGSSCHSGAMWSTGSAWWWVALAACLGCAASVGTLIRTRRSLASTLAERGWLLERERRSATQAAIQAERARLARELHDIVSHNVSVMVVQAGAARQIMARDPDDAARALTAVESAGRDTMSELRQLLGVLAPSAYGDDPDLPQPSLSRLGALVDRIAFAGLPVEVRIDGDLDQLLSGLDTTAYRIIQEALTNALKHGKATAAQVNVRCTAHYLRLEIVNDGPSVLTGTGPETQPTTAPHASAGHGLIGLRERVHAYGGDLDARRRLGGGFRVRAKIPLKQP